MHVYVYMKLYRIVVTDGEEDLETTLQLKNLSTITHQAQDQSLNQVEDFNVSLYSANYNSLYIHVHVCVCL